MRCARVTVLGIGVLAGVGAWLFFRDRAAPSAKAAPAPREAETSEEPPSQTSAPRPPLEATDRAKRDRMREQIWRAFREAPPNPPAPPLHARTRYELPEHGQMWTGLEGSLDATPGIEPEYVRDSVHSQFFPIANKCYVDALQHTPGLAGEIDLWFVIVGNTNIGGIVESVDVLNKSTLRDPAMIECLRESFLSTTFPPPKGGGAVTVEYPIQFSPDDPDAR